MSFFFNPFGDDFSSFGKPTPKKDANTTHYYEILGVPKTATQEEIRKAYRKLVKIKHPDKGGNEQEFQELQTAYDILSDENKRKVYDEYGEEGIKEGISNAPENDFFNLFNTGMHRERKKKSRSVIQQLKVSLEDIYLGTEKQIEIKHFRICKKCKGSGGKNSSSVKKCSTCDGKGYRMVVQRMMMGIIQSQETCPDCNGKGEVIKEKCKECKGKKVTKENKILKILLDKGAPDGKKYVFKGESDEFPDVEPGDIVVEIDIIEHKNFIRKGADLIYKCDISLLEALTGIQIVITHLDQRKIMIKSKKGEIIKPGILKCVSDLGMPFYDNPVRFGNLYLDFNIVFPKNLNEKQINDLKELFPNSDMEVDDIGNITEKYPLTDYNENDENQFATGKDRDDDDEESNEGRQQVRCENQ